MWENTLQWFYSVGNTVSWVVLGVSITHSAMSRNQWAMLTDILSTQWALLTVSWVVLSDQFTQSVVLGVQWVLLSEYYSQCHE